MTREEADFIGSMNMCDEISNDAYKKIMCHCEVNDYEEPQTETETWISMDKSRKITVPKGTFEKILSDADDDFDI